MDQGVSVLRSINQLPVAWGTPIMMESLISVLQTYLLLLDRCLSPVVTLFQEDPLIQLWQAVNCYAVGLTRGNTKALIQGADS